MISKGVHDYSLVKRASTVSNALLVKTSLSGRSTSYVLSESLGGDATRFQMLRAATRQVGIGVAARNHQRGARQFQAHSMTLTKSFVLAEANFKSSTHHHVAQP
jgi:hypothetical protein